MVEINKISQKNEDDIDTIASIHEEAFPSFFLTQLGHSFLKLLYKCYIEDKNSGIIVAKKHNKIIGFIAYSNEYSMFYKYLVKKHIFKFASYSLITAIKHPSFIKRLFGALNKSNDVRKNEKYVELASICVKPGEAGQGVGSKLIRYIKKDVNFNKYKYINLETDADNNIGANNFYIKNGFVLNRTYTTREKRNMNEYRYYGGKK